MAVLGMAVVGGGIALQAPIKRPGAGDRQLRGGARLVRDRDLLLAAIVALSGRTGGTGPAR